MVRVLELAAERSADRIAAFVRAQGKMYEDENTPEQRKLRWEFEAIVRNPDVAQYAAGMQSFHVKYGAAETDKQFRLFLRRMEAERVRQGVT